MWCPSVYSSPVNSVMLLLAESVHWKCTHCMLYNQWLCRHRCLITSSSSQVRRASIMINLAMMAPHWAVCSDWWKSCQAALCCCCWQQPPGFIFCWYKSLRRRHNFVYQRKSAPPASSLAYGTFAFRSTDNRFVYHLAVAVLHSLPQTLQRELHSGWIARRWNSNISTRLQLHDISS